jgi:RpiR family carbohydrate utilization transcriptional regulator
MQEDNPLFQITSKHEEFDPAEGRVADYIVQHLASMPYASIGGIAEEVGTSKTTVNRFCKKIGFAGFKDFKIRVINFIAERSSTISGADIPEKLTDNYSIADLFHWVVQSNVEILSELEDTNKPEQFAQAIEMILKAEKIALVGVGGSAPVALDAELRFSRLGLNCYATTDSHFQIVRSHSLSSKDVIIGISHSGHSKEIYESLKIAKKQGAKTMSITSFPASPIAKISDCVLLNSNKRTSFTSESVASRISQMALIDVLCAGIYLRKKEKLGKYLEEIELLMSNKRI